MYCSSRRARANEDVSGPHQIAKEIAARMEKTRSGGTLEIDFRFGISDTVSLICAFVQDGNSPTPPINVNRVRFDYPNTFDGLYKKCEFTHVGTPAHPKRAFRDDHRRVLPGAWQLGHTHLHTVRVTTLHPLRVHCGRRVVIDCWTGHGRIVIGGVGVKT